MPRFDDSSPSKKPRRKVWAFLQDIDSVSPVVESELDNDRNPSLEASNASIINDQLSPTSSIGTGRNNQHNEFNDNIQRQFDDNQTTNNSQFNANSTPIQRQNNNSISNETDNHAVYNNLIDSNDYLSAKFNDNPETIQRQSNDIPQTVKRQTIDNPTTIQRQKTLFEDPVELISTNSDLASTQNEKVLIDDNPTTDRCQFDDNSASADRVTDDTTATNDRQLNDNSTPKSTTVSTTIINVSLINGSQKSILNFLFERCREMVSKETMPVVPEELSIILGINKKTIIKSLERLVEKGALIRKQYKPGKCGWRTYQIPDGIFKQLTHEGRLNDLIRRQTNDKSTTISTPISPTTASSSSNIQINRILTSQTIVPVVDSQWVDEIDYSAVSSFSIQASTVRRCLELYPTLQPEQLVDLVYRFGIYIKAPPIKILNPRAFFISLAKQASRGEEPLSHILTPEEELAQQALVLSRAEKERVKQQLIEKQQVYEQEKERASETAFEALSLDEQNLYIEEVRKQIPLGLPEFIVKRVAIQRWLEKSGVIKS